MVFIEETNHNNGMEERCYFNKSIQKKRKYQSYLIREKNRFFENYYLFMWFR